MAGLRQWADEIENSAPLPALEPFFILAALELGDPDSEREWLMKHAADFHVLYRRYRGALDTKEYDRIPGDSAGVLIQYMVWYPREASRLNSGKA